MKRYYCTYFNYNYLPTFFSLYDSMKNKCGDFQLYCVCMDIKSRDFLREAKLEHVVLIDIAEVEKEFGDLKKAKSNRSLIEYFFTCTSSISYYIIKNYKEIDLLTYLDADLYFFSSPEPIFSELDGKSVGIIEHKFYGLGKRNLKYGKYNVGWISFRNNPEGIDCLRKWRSNCIEWCYDRLEEGRFADQKYLDKWPSDYPSVHVIDNIGANVGPWNIGRYAVSGTTDKVLINNERLIFYHFASFKRVSKTEYSTSLSKYFLTLKGSVESLIYRVYTDVIYQHTKRLSFEIRGEVRKGNSRSNLLTFSGILNWFRNQFFDDSISIDADV